MAFPNAIHLGKAAGVPQLGAKVAVARDTLGIELKRPAKACHRRIGKAQRICAEFVDDLKRINDIAQGFRHLLALGVAHQPVQIDRLERHLIDHCQLHHHHAGDPEKDDIGAGDQRRGGEIARQFIGLLGPAQGANRPEPRGEPGVKNVRVAGQRLALGQSLRLCLGGRTIMIAVGIIPNRDLMPPPQLARDAPRLDILQPVEIGLLARLWHDLGRARTHGLQRRLDDLGGVHKPLIGQHRLDHHL